jgi:hypothetical protein
MQSCERADSRLSVNFAVINRQKGAPKDARQAVHASAPRNLQRTDTIYQPGGPRHLAGQLHRRYPTNRHQQHQLGSHIHAIRKMCDSLGERML